MFHFSIHKWLGVLFELPQASLVTKIYSPALIFREGIIFGVLQRPTAGCDRNRIGFLFHEWDYKGGDGFVACALQQRKK
jgi:hypothetical protein